jgi:hypothetical protein
MPIELDGFTFEKSARKHKKYQVRVGNKRVHFGDNRYGQYHDKIGLYTNLDHNDDVRRNHYYARHGIDAVLYSPRWFSHHFLW